MKYLITDLSSANSETNSNVKLIVPPATKPAINRPIYSSVAFVESILSDQLHYSMSNKEFFFRKSVQIYRIHKMKIITNWGIIITVNVFFRPNPSPSIVKNMVPIKAPK